MSAQPSHTGRPRVLLTGASGYVGGKLLPQLLDAGYLVNCLTRHPGRVNAAQQHPQLRVVTGGVQQEVALAEALAGVSVAYYLVHQMEAGAHFEERDRELAEQFADACRRAEVETIVYLGGLGTESDGELSPHLRSRHAVGEILRASGVPVCEFRASIVIGPGSLSFDMLTALTRRLPVMLCPAWVSTPTQPIAIADLLRYLLAPLSIRFSESRILEIGCADQTTYGDLIREYARQAGLRRWLIRVPLLTPYLSSLWLSLVTPANATVGRHLVEGLRNPTIVRDSTARQIIPLEPMTVAAAIAAALRESAGK